MSSPGLPSKVCPACDAEFRHEILRCSDCGSELVVAGSALPRGPAIEVGAKLRPLRSAPLAWARELSRRLSEAGIPHRMEAEADDPKRAARRALGEWRARVEVREEDLAAARAIDSAQLREEIPDLPAPEDLTADLEGGCPACGAPCPPDAPECPSCGLVVPGIDAECPRCGGRVEAEQASCPACGWVVEPP